MQCDFRNRNAYFYGSPKGLRTVNGQVRKEEDENGEDYEFNKAEEYE